MIGKILVVLMVLLPLFPAASSAGTVQLPQTGQESCYDEHGALIPCYGTGQDGEIQAGYPWPSPRFSSSYGPEADCMIDHLTGLMWPKNGNLMSGKKTWNDAIDQVNALNHCGHSDWRLPNINELESLVNVFAANPAAWFNTHGFANVQPDGYWSSSTHAPNADEAWYVQMGYGFLERNGKTFDFYAWPVRSGEPDPSGSVEVWRTGQTVSYRTGDDGDLRHGASWPAPRFGDPGSGEVTDNLTGLVWSKDANSPGPSTCSAYPIKTWQQALDYVKCLNAQNYLGHRDWRLPNRQELHSLSDYAGGLPSGHPFTNVQSIYWSSSTVAGLPGNAWTVGINIGDISFPQKDNYNDVWPVRAGQVRPIVTLTVTKSGKGNGSVTTDTGAIVWNGNVGTVPYYEGTSITLSATPDSWSTFAGWTGACSGRGACRMTTSGDTQVVADFPVAGDVNSDGAVGLADAVLALGMLSLDAPDQTLFHEADVDGDGKIGLAETIYVVQCLARVRNNHPPVWNPIGNRTVNEGSTLTFTVSAEDADGDALTYSAAPLPSGATFDAVTRTFSWSPTYSQSGNHQIAFTAKDDYGGEAAETITLSVNDVFTFKASEYFPLSPGAWWDYTVNPPGDVERSEIVGTKMIGGQSTMRLRYPSGDEYYYTSDQNGLRLYGQYGGTDIVFDAPLLLIPEDAFMGTNRVSTSNYTVVNGHGATSHVEITSTVDIVALEDVPTTWFTLKDCVKVCFRYDQYVSETALSIPGDPFCLWLYKGLGAAKQAVGSSTAIIKQSSYMNLSP